MKTIKINNNNPAFTGFSNISAGKVGEYYDKISYITGILNDTDSKDLTQLPELCKTFYAKSLDTKVKPAAKFVLGLKYFESCGHNLILPFFKCGNIVFPDKNRNNNKVSEELKNFIFSLLDRIETAPPKSFNKTKKRDKLISSVLKKMIKQEEKKTNLIKKQAEAKGYTFAKVKTVTDNISNSLKTGMPLQNASIKATAADLKYKLKYYFK